VSLDAAQALDADDAIRGLRAHFNRPGPNGSWTYLCGNSLGLQPRGVAEQVQRDLDDWARLGVEGHFEAETPWFSYHEAVRDDMALVVGALPLETVVMNSLTVNLHLMLASFYRPVGERTLILMEGGAFPSDQYAVATHLAVRGLDAGQHVVWMLPRDGEATLREEDVLEAIERAGSRLALVLMAGVHYYTGQAFPMAAVTQAAHDVRAQVGFDLAHAAGNLEVRLHDWDVDFAVWCSYKYLNGGPGGVGAAFVHERHAHCPDRPRLAGWWGNDPHTRFTMPDTFIAQPGADGWQISNAPVLAMAALRPSLALFRQAGMAALRQKSVRLGDFLLRLLRENVPEVEVLTPPAPESRGCQISVRLTRTAKPIVDALRTQGVIVDYRAPDVIRVAPVPLYNSFVDVAHAVEQLVACLRTVTV
jgi:kynureninase